MIILYSIVLGRCCLITCLSRSVDYLFIMEIWKDIVGYEWLYEVSNLWRIKSLKLWKSDILKLRYNKWWYPFTSISRNWWRKSYLVHRLVAIAFIENPFCYDLVLHKDSDRKNCNKDNLKWWTTIENNLQRDLEWKNVFNFNNPMKKSRKWYEVLFM